VDPSSVSPEGDFDYRRWPGLYPKGQSFTDWLGQWFSTILNHFFGWLVTIVALTFGAPFWFDLLGKVVTLRSSGKRPANKTQDDSSTN
jgi:hypothetical protein